MIIKKITWTCEKCGFTNVLLVDDIYGPSGEDICGNCDSVFDINYLIAEHLKREGVGK